MTTMKKYSKYSLNLTVAIFVLYFTCGLTFVAYPFVIYAILQTKEPSLPILIPGVNFNSYDGFVITTTYHYIIIVLSINGLAFCDVLILNFVLNVHLMSELQIIQLSKMNDKLFDSKESESAIRVRLSNFLLMHQEMGK